MQRCALTDCQLASAHTRTHARSHMLIHIHVQVEHCKLFSRTQKQAARSDRPGCVLIVHDITRSEADLLLG